MERIFNNCELTELRSDPYLAYRLPISKENLLKFGCIIYGAGVEGRLILGSLKEAGIAPLYFVDRNPALHGVMIDEVMVMPPEALPSQPNCYVIIASCYVRSIVNDNPYLKNKKVILWSSINGFCPVLPELPDTVDAFWENDSVYKAYELMADEKSKIIFRNFIKFHILFSQDIFFNYDPECYFPRGLPINHSCFIDAGAADGDTFKSWLKKGFPVTSDDRYFAFEPSPSEYESLKSFVSGLPTEIREKVTIYNAGLGDLATILYLSCAGKSSRLTKHAMNNDNNIGRYVQVMRVDDVLASFRPTFLKADVEGAEMHLLEGAKDTIARCLPDMAISVYHRYSDIWNIPLWIVQQNDNYNIFLRHHSRAYDDVVCYALQKK